MTIIMINSAPPPAEELIDRKDEQLKKMAEDNAEVPFGRRPTDRDDRAHVICYRT